MKFEGRQIIVEKDEEGWLHIDFMCNFTNVSFPNDYAEEVIDELKNAVKLL